MYPLLLTVACWKEGYYRGVGIASTCPDPNYPNKIGNTCYPNCNVGYVPEAAPNNLNCLYICPQGWNDDGVNCNAFLSSYGRTSGYIS